MFGLKPHLAQKTTHFFSAGSQHVQAMKVFGIPIRFENHFFASVFFLGGTHFGVGFTGKPKELRCAILVGTLKKRPTHFVHPQFHEARTNKPI